MIRIFFIFFFALDYIFLENLREISSESLSQDYFWTR